MRKNVKVPKLNKTESDRLQNQLPKAQHDPPIDIDLFEINQRAGLNDYLVEGDINLDESQMESYRVLISGAKTRGKRQVANVAVRWPGNTIYFYADATINQRKLDVITAAHNYVMTRTCIKFVNDRTATNRIVVTNADGCWSYVGMVGGEQQLSLGDGCEVMGTVAHEFSHAFGLFHSQQRADRDTAVTVDLTDVDSSYQGNFVKYSAASTTNYVPYEYGSFMHYPTTAFVSSGGRPSIIPKDSAMVYTMGNRLVSFYDISSINQHYKCTCPTAGAPKCANGGYPNPADCTKCNCPLGYGGDLCNQRPDVGCGEDLTATTAWQSVTYRFGNLTFASDSRDVFDLCFHWVKAPVGSTIQFKLTAMFNPQCSYGCIYNGIEPKVKADQLMTNTRYCCTDFFDKVLNSEVNPLPVVSYNRYYYSQNTWSYRYVLNTTTTASTPTTTSKKPTTTMSTTTTVTSEATTTPTTTTKPPATLCQDLLPASTCTSLKSCGELASIPKNEQKLKCAQTLDLCGQSSDTPCDDYYADCTSYKSAGRCASDPPLVAEYNCAKTCGFCSNPV